MVSKKHIFTLAAICFIFTLIGQPFVTSAQDTPLTLTLLGEHQFPTSTRYEDVLFGGISGISYDSEADVYYAISDDRAEEGPVRFYTLSIEIDASGVQDAQILSMISIMTPDGEMYAENAADPESIRFLPMSQTLVWTSERDSSGNSPLLREMALDGTFIHDYAIDSDFVRSGSRMGIRSNESFEALAVSEDESILFVGTESALEQDGDSATLEAGTPSRIWLLDRDTGDTITQYVYVTEPIPDVSTGSSNVQDNGLVALVYLDETHLIALERSFVLGYGNTINIFLVDLEGASDVQSAESIEDIDYGPVSKTHLLTLNEETEGINVDNIEGATWGPIIDGQRTLILVSDNNFNPSSQPYTQIVVFTVTE